MNKTVLPPLVLAASLLSACTEDAPAKKSNLLTSGDGGGALLDPSAPLAEPDPDAGLVPDGGTATIDAAECSLAKPSGSPSCDTCLELNCCAFANACEASPDCLALLACYAACAADAGVFSDGRKEAAPCVTACDAAHPQSLSSAATYFSCRTSLCVKDCPK